MHVLLSGSQTWSPGHPSGGIPTEEFVAISKGRLANSMVCFESLLQELAIIKPFAYKEPPSVRIESDNS